MLSEDLPSLARERRDTTVRLLAGFDVYVAGTRPHDSLVEPRYKDSVFRKAGWISPVLSIGGSIAGVWSQEKRGGRVVVSVELFRRLSGAQRRSVGDEADRLGRFLATPATVTLGGP
jgi:winged helix DNA-binding protein